MSASYVEHPFTFPLGVKGKPFQAQFERADTQKISEGQITQQTKTGAIYRDSNGRSRREIRETKEVGVIEHQVIIHDLVNQVGLFLDPESRTAARMPMPSMIHDGEQSPPVLENFAKVSTEIGQKIIEKFTCRGFKLKHSDGGLTEYWISEELLEILLAKYTYGDEESILRLFNIQCVEPEESLFTTPAGYTEEIL